MSQNPEERPGQPADQERSGHTPGSGAAGPYDSGESPAGDSGEGPHPSSTDPYDSPEGASGAPGGSTGSADQGQSPYGQDESGQAQSQGHPYGQTQSGGDPYSQSQGPYGQSQSGPSPYGQDQSQSPVRRAAPGLLTAAVRPTRLSPVRRADSRFGERREALGTAGPHQHPVHRLHRSADRLLGLQGPQSVAEGHLHRGAQLLDSLHHRLSGQLDPHLATDRCHPAADRLHRGADLLHSCRPGGQPTRVLPLPAELADHQVRVPEPSTGSP